VKFVLFSVSGNGENELGDEGADGTMPLPQNFSARSAPDSGEGCSKTQRHQHPQVKLEGLQYWKLTVTTENT